MGYTFALTDENDSNDSGEEFKKPIKKRPLADMRQATFQAEQDRKFDQIMALLEGQQQQQQHLDVDPDVDTFVNGIAFSLQKSTGQQRETLC